MSSESSSSGAFGADGFVGRVHELATVRRALDDAVAGHGSLVVLIGEPGIGKTRLAEEVTRAAEQRGVRVLLGRAYPGEGAPAFWPWVTLLRRLASLAGPERMEEWLGSGGAVIAPIAPDVTTREAAPAAPIALQGDAARFRLFDAVATTLERAAADAPLLIVLDDLHWADEGSLRLLAFAARQLGRARILFLGTARAVEMRVAVDAAVREELARSAEYVELGGLAPDEVVGVMRSLLGAEPAADLAAAVQEATDGNPFFVEAILRALTSGADAPAPSAARLVDLHLPDGVRDAIRARLRPLGDGTRRLLAIAALLGRESATGVVARVADLHVEAVGAALDEAERFGLVGPLLAAGRRRFAHALIGETLVADLPPLERARLHRRIGDVLEPMVAVGTATLDEVASHYLEAVPAGAAEQAIVWAEKAARAASARLGYEEAVRYYRRALAVLDAAAEATTGAAAARRVDLLLSLGEAERRVGDTAAAQATHRRAATLAAEAGLAPRLARAALAFGSGLGGFWDQSPGSVDPERVSVVRQALDALGPAPSGLRALLLAQLSASLFWSGAPERSATVPELGREAIAMAATATPAEQLAVMVVAHWTTWGPDDPAGRLAHALEIVRRAAELDQPEAMLRGRMYAAAHHLELGAAAAADQEIVRFTALATEWGLERQLWYVQVYRGMRAHLAGRFDDMEAAAAAGLALGGAAQPFGARFAFDAQRTLLRREQGRVAETVEPLTRTAAALPGMPIWAAALTVALVETGDLAAARRELDRLATERFGAVQRNFLWLYAMTQLSRACAGLDAGEHAAVLYDLLAPYAGQVAVAQHGVLCDGAVTRYLGLLAATLERWEDADRHFTAALALNDRLGARILVTATQYDQACMLRRRAARGDAARADTLLAAAATEARALGQVALVERMDRLAVNRIDRAGVDRPAPPTVEDVCTVRRVGADWSVTHTGRTFTLKDMIGVGYLLTLLRQPGREIHARELVTGDGTPHAASDAGEMLDERARADYRARLAELGAELEEAETFNDRGRAENARVEIDRLTDELSRAVGLGGRARRAGSDTDRARLNVTRAVRRAIEVIATEDPALGSDLSRGVRTGTFCSYTPDPRIPLNWQI